MIIKNQILVAILDLAEKRAGFLTNKTKCVGLPRDAPFEVVTAFKAAANAWQVAADVCQNVIEQFEEMDRESSEEDSLPATLKMEQES